MVCPFCNVEVVKGDLLVTSEVKTAAGFEYHHPHLACLVATNPTAVVVTVDTEHPATKFRLGGDVLAAIDQEAGKFYVLTGLASGVWGPFPVAAIASQREPVATDSWPVSGCPSERWTFGQFLARRERNLKQQARAYDPKMW